jgi:methyl-accepting chemotaxis protein
MKIKFIIFLITTTLITSCASIPKETVLLSQTLGKDLKILHNSHRNIVQLYYKKIKDNINVFVEEVYTPYNINYRLNKELQNYKNGKYSLYGLMLPKPLGSIVKLDTLQVNKEVINYMEDILFIVKSDIEDYRDELLSPIETEERELLNKINQSYENVLLANASITNYLKSIRKLKETQQEMLSMVGLSGADTKVINSLVTISEKVNEAVKAGKKINIESDKALEEIEKVTKKIKKLTTKN